MGVLTIYYPILHLTLYELKFVKEDIYSGASVTVIMVLIFYRETVWR